MASMRIVFLTIFEFLLILTNLFLFSYGYPDSTRMRLWEEGGAQLFNSNPKLRIYFYANYREPPEIPYIWSQKLTDFNLAVAVLGLWIFFARVFVKCLGAMSKWTELYLQCCVLPFWILCFLGQQSSDLTDDKHPSRYPWYLTHSCSIAEGENYKACRVAQGSFAVTILSMCFYVVWIWGTVAGKALDYLLTIHRTRAKASIFERGALIEMQRLTSGDVEFDDDGLFTQAWDDD